VKPYALRVNGREHPLELDDDHLRFTWRLSPGAHGATVATHRVELWSETADGARDQLIWNSGEIGSDEVAIDYAGPKLGARSAYRWVVTIVDTHGSTTPEISRFETGVRGDWSATWIGRGSGPWLDSAGETVALGPATAIGRSWQTMYAKPPLQLRREFQLHELPIRARLYVSAHGVYRAYLNGTRAGIDELTPGWTRYESRLEYQAYDVTESLEPGGNVLAAHVADGWWAGNIGYNTRRHADQYGDRTEFIAELHLEFADGAREIITTDNRWVEKPGSITMADLLMGEYHDTALATDGWLLPSFDASGWRPVDANTGSTETLIGQRAEPVRAVAEVSPISIAWLPSGAAIVDFGQNLTGRVRLALTGLERGDIIQLRHGEVLDDGHLYTDNLRSAEARDVVVANGSDAQVFEPLFTFHGFRYLEVEGWRGQPSSLDVTAIVLSSDIAPTGDFRTSSALVNKLYSNIVWSQRGNFVAVPMDCPQRDERLGWTADTQVFAPTAAWNSDVEAFLSRWLLDVNDGQAPSGNVPDVAPVPPMSTNFSTGSPGWGDAAVIVPWTLYRTYGDRTFLERQFPAMKAWVDYIAAVNPTTIWTNSLGNNHGDWLSVDAHTPKLVVAGAYRIRSTDLLARAAQALGKVDEAAYYSDEAVRLRELFRSNFIDTDGRVLGETQTGYLFALAWDLAPESQRSQIAGHLVADIINRGKRLTTGFLGVSLLCSTLTRIGRADLAYDILFQEQFPSWGYTIHHGATTIWERWDGYTEHAGFQSKEMNSFNHYSLGSVGEWLFSGVAGISQAENSVGFRRLRIEPHLTGRFDSVDASFESVRGKITVSWSREGGDYLVAVGLPPGTSAEVILPGETHEITGGEHSFRLAAQALPAEHRPGVLVAPAQGGS
jgi:alpha-L-rhamnosidase